MATNGVSPPPFREALVERGPLTLTASWQRWLDAFWQQQTALWEHSLKPFVLGTGAADKVGVWQDASTLTSDALFTYDRTQHWLGIGTATPRAPLSFASTTGPKIYLYDADLPGPPAGVSRFGFEVAPGLLQVFTSEESGLALGDMRLSDGTTFREWARFQTNTGYLGLGTPTPSARLTVSGDTFLNGHLGVPYTAPVNVWMRSGSLSADSLYLSGGDMAPRWPLDCPGQGHVAQLGVYYGPDPSYSLRAASAGVDSLCCFGTGQFHGNVGLAYPPTAGYHLRTGIAWMDRLVVGGGDDSRFYARFYGQIYCDGVPYSGVPGPWQAYSDRRLKHNIETIPHALDTMTRLRGVLYEWTNPAEHGNRTGVQMGCVAQEVEAVLPTWVGELSGFKTTQLSAFEALAIESFKDVLRRLEAIEDNILCL